MLILIQMTIYVVHLLLVKGTDYEVDFIDMGNWYTTIYLLGYDYGFNSIYFTFYEDGKQIDIYRDKRFNKYI